MSVKYRTAMLLFIRLIIGLMTGLIAYSAIYLQLKNFIALSFSYGLIIYLTALQLHLVKTKTSHYIFLLLLSFIYGLSINYFHINNLTLLKSISSNEVYYSFIFSLYYLLPYISFFIVYIFYCASIQGKTFNYRSLFYYSWQKVLLIILGLFFSYLLNIIFDSANMLFWFLGFDYFNKIIYSMPYLIITPPIYFAIGIHLFSQYKAVINNTRLLLLTLFKVLYPLYALLLGLFLITLIFNSSVFYQLWWVMTLLILAHIFMFNAVYQTGNKPLPYPKVITILLKLVILLQPFYMACIIYFAMTTIYQQGLDFNYYLKFIFITIAFAYSSAYSASVILNRYRSWLKTIATCNIYLSLLVAIIFFLITTPLMHPQNIIHYFN